MFEAGGLSLTLLSGGTEAEQGNAMIVGERGTIAAPRLMARERIECALQWDGLPPGYRHGHCGNALSKRLIHCVARGQILNTLCRKTDAAVSLCLR